MNRFFVTYPGVRTYIDETQNFVRQFGFVWTYTGRRRRFERIKFNPSKGELNRIFRQAVNARIQTTSSDLVTYNLIDTGNWLDTMRGRILLTVHDSIVFQLPKNAGPVYSDIRGIVTDKTHERAPWLPVEWKFDIGKGPNYGNAHEEVV